MTKRFISLQNIMKGRRASPCLHGNCFGVMFSFHFRRGGGRWTGKRGWSCVNHTHFGCNTFVVIAFHPPPPPPPLLESNFSISMEFWCDLFVIYYIDPLIFLFHPAHGDAGIWPNLGIVKLWGLFCMRYGFRGQPRESQFRQNVRDS